MDKNYQRVWKGVTKTNDENKAVRALSGILADKEGRNFILRLKRNDAGLCIEILDRVSHNLHPLPAFVVSDGLARASQSTI